MLLLLCSATSHEIKPFWEWLNENFYPVTPFHFKHEKLEVKVLITGIGTAYTGASVGLMLGREKFDLAINAGIAGAFNEDLKPGDVVNVVSEQFGDLGIEESDGSFEDLFESGLAEAGQFPFTGTKLINPNLTDFGFLVSASGLTVNRVHGFAESIDKVKARYQVDIESMEGGAFFMACLMAGLPFLEIRAISNYVESRNRENWNIPLAVANLNDVLIQILKSLKD